MEHFFGISPTKKEVSSDLSSISEVCGENSPEKALLFRGKSVSIISGRSKELTENGFKPHEEPYFNTELALRVTKYLAYFHAYLKANKMKKLNSNNDSNKEEKEVKIFENSEKCQKNIEDQISQRNQNYMEYFYKSSLASANLSILCSQFRESHVSPDIVDKLESLKGDIGTFTEFLRFISSIQTKNLLQSVGPVCMCDIWVPKSEADESLVIRLRGGENAQKPPMHDVTWIWLTLVQPQILRERHVEFCNCYTSVYNESIKNLETTEELNELTQFDVMNDLGDSFLQGFLTVIHKFTISGTWTLDRRLFTSEGVRNLADSLGFLVENGIIGSIYVA